MISREICMDSGYLVTSCCTHTRREIFPEGKQPKELCPIHNAGRTLDLHQDDRSFDLLDRQSWEESSPNDDPNR